MANDKSAPSGSGSSGLFVSDLHLFSRRSDGERRWEDCRAVVQQSDWIVLGGDIFDFRWSCHRELSESLDAARRWLEASIAIHDQATWHYLLGNHDCHPKFQNVLEQLAQSYSQFRWHHRYLRFDGQLFLHGDILDARWHSSGLAGYRERFQESRAKGPIANWLYDSVVRTRAHRLIAKRRHPILQTAQRLLDAISHMNPEALDSVVNIYFGHTHVPMAKVGYRGIQFHNPGSGIRHLDFSPVVISPYVIADKK